jgi:ribonucleoside-diphosphate reductase beta chain
MVTPTWIHPRRDALHGCLPEDGCLLENECAPDQQAVHEELADLLCLLNEKKSLLMSEGWENTEEVYADSHRVRVTSLADQLSIFMDQYVRDVKVLDTAKYSIFPLQHPTLYEFFETQRDMFWVSAEIDFSNDRYSWDSLQENEREFLLFILFFFSQADGIVMENLSTNFQEEIPFKEAKAFYAMQNAVEAIHAETYALMIETVVRDEETKLRATNAIQHCPEITAMAAWVSFWMRREHPLEVRIFAFAVYEGVFFNVGFVPIRWLGAGDKNKVPGFIQSNELISRDEALHMNFAVMLLRVLGFVGDQRYEEQVKLIVSSSFEIVSALIRRSLDGRGLIGMTSEEMIEFTKVVYNTLTSSLEFEEPFPGVSNPFPWMLAISMSNKTNFFEQKVTEYRKVNDTEYKFEVKPDGTW